MWPGLEVLAPQRHQLRPAAERVVGDGKQAAVLRRLQAQLKGVCAKVDAADGQRAACDGLLKPAAKSAA